mmetsp:Transcript_111768/g.316143  ORF Transcript_111768/g.316143 Transcript_111768/m.316143 type:complete len:393 (-) Transcript_111768:200-1378(-)
MLLGEALQDLVVGAGAQGVAEDPHVAARVPGPQQVVVTLAPAVRGPVGEEEQSSSAGGGQAPAAPAVQQEAHGHVQGIDEVCAPAFAQSIDPAFQTLLVVSSGGNHRQTCFCRRARKRHHIDHIDPRESPKHALRCRLGQGHATCGGHRAAPVDDHDHVLGPGRGPRVPVPEARVVGAGAKIDAGPLHIGTVLLEAHVQVPDPRGVVVLPSSHPLVGVRDDHPQAFEQAVAREGHRAREVHALAPVCIHVAEFASTAAREPAPGAAGLRQEGGLDLVARCPHVVAHFFGQLRDRMQPCFSAPLEPSGERVLCPAGGVGIVDFFSWEVVAPIDQRKVAALLVYIAPRRPAPAWDVGLISPILIPAIWRQGCIPRHAHQVAVGGWIRVTAATFA